MGTNGCPAAHRRAGMTDAEFWADVANTISGRGESGSDRSYPALHPDGALASSGTLYEQMHDERSAACNYGISGHLMFPIGFVDDNPDDDVVDLDEHVDDRPPCPDCGATGACAYDSEGRPMIHVADGGSS